MIIPGISKEEIYEIITKVAKNHRNKKFLYLTEEDIEYKAWEIALEQIQDFNVKRGKVENPKKCLEHWLNAVVSNRLKNYYRDEFEVKKKSKVMSASSLTYDVDVHDTNDLAFTFENKELWDLIISNLSANYLDILDAVLSGEKISPYYKTKLQSKIRTIWRTKWNSKNQ